MSIDISDDVYYYCEYPRMIYFFYEKELLLQFSPNSFDLHQKLGHAYIGIPEYIEKSIYHQQEALRLMQESEINFGDEYDEEEVQMIQQIMTHNVSGLLEAAKKIKLQREQGTERTRYRMVRYLEEYIQSSNDEQALKIVKWLNTRNKEGF